MEPPPALSRRHALLLLIACAASRWRSPGPAPAPAPPVAADGFVIVDGWVLPAELFARA